VFKNSVEERVNMGYGITKKILEPPIWS